MSNISRTRKVALITGAATGIGKGIALRLAQDGLDVAINDLPHTQDKLDLVAEAARAFGVRAITVKADVSSEEDVNAMIQQTVEAMGSLDVMIANAGIAEPIPFLEMDVKSLDKVFNVNVRGVFLCYQAAAKQMIKQGRGGKLLAACSTSGLQTFRNTIGYCASKFAVRSINQGAAIELGEYGITANVYCPGTIDDTDLWLKHESERTKLQGRQPGDLTKELAALNPQGRNGKVSDVAAVVSFLCSKDAAFLSGQSLMINGGDIVS